MSNTWQPVNIGEGGFTDGMDVVSPSPVHVDPRIQCPGFRLFHAADYDLHSASVALVDCAGLNESKLAQRASEVLTNVSDLDVSLGQHPHGH